MIQDIQKYEIARLKKNMKLLIVLKEIFKIKKEDIFSLLVKFKDFFKLGYILEEMEKEHIFYLWSQFENVKIYYMLRIFTIRWTNW